MPKNHSAGILKVPLLTAVADQHRGGDRNVTSAAAAPKAAAVDPPLPSARTLNSHNMALFNHLWHSARVLRRAHTLAGDQFAFYKFVFMVMLIACPLLSTFCGSVYFTFLFPDMCQEELSVVLSIYVGFMMIVQAKMNCDAHIEAHTKAVERCRRISVNIKNTVTNPPLDEVLFDSTMLNIRSSISDAVTSSPHVSEACYDKAASQVDRVLLCQEIPKSGPCCARILELTNISSSALALVDGSIDDLLMITVQLSQSKVLSRSGSVKRQTMVIIVGTLFGSFAVLATLISALRYVNMANDSADRFIRWSGAISNSAVSVVAMVEGHGGLNDQAKELAAMSASLADMGLSIEVLLKTQPHYDADRKAKELAKCATKLMEKYSDCRKTKPFMRHRGHADVQKQFLLVKAEFYGIVETEPVTEPVIASPEPWSARAICFFFGGKVRLHCNR